MGAIRPGGGGGGGGIGGGGDGSLSNEVQGALLSRIFGVPVVLLDPAVMLIECNDLATTPLGAAFVYDDEALTLTLDADIDINGEADPGEEFALNARFLFHFLVGDSERSGVFDLIDFGEDGVRPPQWRRATDMDATGDLVAGLTVPVPGDGGATVLQRMTTPGPYTLDTTQLHFSQLTAATS